MGHLGGPDLLFVDLGWISGPLRIHFCIVWIQICDLACAYGSWGSEPGFVETCSSDFVRETDILWKAVCAENVVNTLAFIRLCVFRSFKFQMLWGKCFG